MTLTFPFEAQLSSLFSLPSLPCSAAFLVDLSRRNLVPFSDLLKRFPAKLTLLSSLCYFFPFNLTDSFSSLAETTMLSRTKSMTKQIQSR